VLPQAACFSLDDNFYPIIIIGTNYWELSEIIVQENNAACRMISTIFVHLLKNRILKDFE